MTAPKVYAWVLQDRLTGQIDHVEFADTPPSFPHSDDDTNRFVYEGYVNGGDSILLYGDGMKAMPQPRHNESRAIRVTLTDDQLKEVDEQSRQAFRARNVRTADWDNEA